MWFLFIFVKIMYMYSKIFQLDWTMKLESLHDFRDRPAKR